MLSYTIVNLISLFSLAILPQSGLSLILIPLLYGIIYLKCDLRKNNWFNINSNYKVVLQAFTGLSQLIIGLIATTYIKVLIDVPQLPQFDKETASVFSLTLIKYTYIVSAMYAVVPVFFILIINGLVLTAFHLVDESINK